MSEKRSFFFFSYLPDLVPRLSWGGKTTHLGPILGLPSEKGATTNIQKIVLDGSPRARFEHSGVLPGAKLRCEHDGNSEIINCER